MTTASVKRVLIVDDTRTIRAMLRAYIESDPRLVCVGEAGDPYEARDKIKALNPDVITLDVEMPRMNGLVFLEHLMRLRPMPVVMVSTRTTQNSEAAIRALSLGAVDCIDLIRFQGDPNGAAKLTETLWTAAGATVGQRRGQTPSAASASRERLKWNGKFVVIGSSTGGVDALETVLAGFPEDCPPTLIAQHMPAAFLRSFSERLNGMIAPRVAVLNEACIPGQGQIFLSAGGGVHGRVSGRAQVRFEPVPDSMAAQYVPSVDVLFQSAVPQAQNCVAAMLTGMGRDGADAMLSLRSSGAWTIAQSGRTAVIDGMPRAARELGAAIEVADLNDMGARILAATSHARTDA